MQESVKERIKAVLVNKNRTVTSVSKQAGIPQNTLSRQLNGATSLSVDVVLSIFGLFPDVSMEWLFRGKGNMFLNNNETKQVNTEALLREIIREKDEKIEKLSREIGELEARLKLAQNTYPSLVAEDRAKYDKRKKG